MNVILSFTLLTALLLSSESKVKGEGICNGTEAITCKFFHSEKELQQEVYKLLKQNLPSSLSVKEWSIRNSTLKQFIPKDFKISKLLNYLYILDSTIDTLPSGGFDGLDNVVVYASFNTVFKNWEDGALTGLTSVKEVTLTECQLQEIPQDIKYLTTLTSLVIESNNIPVIKQNDFSFLKNLKTLMIGENKIKEIIDRPFSGLRNLKNLDLRGNLLTSINTDMFDGLTTLDLLNVADNRISYFDPNIYNIFPQIKYVNFLGNNISEDNLVEMRKMVVRLHTYRR